jgi:CheY-like chemotaxis protein
MELTLEPVDVGAAIGEAVAMLAGQAKKRNVALEFTALAPHERVHVDARRLKQILLNLVSNALKFTPEGGHVSAEATMATRQQVEGPPPGYSAGTRLPLPASNFADFLQISVSDTGIGLSRDDMKSLFSPFTQVANAVTKSIEGTGLGLVMVHQLARLHGGTVAVTSEPGEGSCFTIWLPWRDAVEENLGEPDKAAAPTSLRRGCLALVIEDDDKAAELMRLQLEAEGLQVRRVASAEEAIACASEFTPDLITLDILLPGMDGWEFLERAQHISAWRNVPVVVVSVVADEGRGFSLGASLVLQKPVGRDALRQGLDRFGLSKEAGRERAVLVIDDDPAAVDLLAAHLNAMDCIVLRALGGKEGIELAKRFEPELITLDLEMPDVNGFDVVEALKAQPSTAGIPIVVITSKDLSAADRRSLSGHVLDIVGKAEFNHGRFIGEVRRAMAVAT